MTDASDRLRARLRAVRQPEQLRAISHSSLSKPVAPLRQEAAAELVDRDALPPAGGKEFVTQTQIAKRLAVTPQAVHNWARKRNVGFPPPARVPGRVVWDWALVVEWARTRRA